MNRPISDADKIALLNNKWSPPASFVYPVSNGRRYNSSLEEHFCWLRYSKSRDAAVCACCLLFGSAALGRNNIAEVFRTTSFCDWKNAMGSKRGMLTCHHNSEVHREAFVKASSFKDIADGTSSNICSHLSASYEKSLKERREILLSLIDIIVCLAKRNIPFRGHIWNKETKRENGNFDFFVHWKSEFDPVLKHHIEHCSKNASYTSPAIQNELITLAGDYVKNQILASARAARWFSIMADECMDSATIEQMSLCIRYLERIGTSGEEFEIREEFIGFVALEKADAEFTSRKIVEYLKKCELDLCNLRGEGYDGATVMSGKVSGVCTWIQQIQPRALYHHC